MNKGIAILSSLLALSGCFRENPSVDPVVEGAPERTSGDGDGSSSVSTSSGGANTSAATSGTTSFESGTGGTATNSLPTTASGETTTREPETSNPCRDFEFCTPLPRDWNGFSVTTGGDRCPDDFPLQEESGFTSALAGPANCGCECLAPTLCASMASLAVRFGAECIDAGGASWALAASTQVVTGNIQNVSGQDRFTLMHGEPSAEDCVADAVEDIPSISEVGEQLLCSGSDMLEACDDLYCGDTPASERICIHRDGVHLCPETYTTRTVLYRNIDDERECSSCGCTEISGSCSGVGVDFYDEGDALLYSRDAGSCLPFTDSFEESYVVLDPGDFSGSCVATESVPIGEAIPASPFTVCCSAV